MKVEHTKFNSGWQPKTISMTFETEQEFNAFRDFMELLDHNDIAKSLNVAYPHENVDIIYDISGDLYDILRQID